ncbi:MAG: sigma-70 family RNA polymerase sigma factor [Verrucomicrobia bacterium]|nr:MAG: sigma-70 family RNA polymerase sigma factor [Verrucomicrobiota bacterium]
MMDKTLNDLGQDAAAVAAVRNGDAERYRELVERHERRVFAVAWSRLGDAALAEEATQEAFIRGYRRLWLLGDGAKFSGWITSVARNAAINLGLRHRRELNKRERWALEHPATAVDHNPTGEADPLHTPETLRQTLAELPAAHRECLVLFYIEGKSGTEAATALGISESALRVRLHRARAAMRERLEEKLAGSLAKLSPSKTLVPAIMAGVFASSSAKAATAGGSIIASIGAKTFGSVAKVGLFSWFFPLISVIGSLPGILFAWRFSKLEHRNFLDQDGFRPQLYGKFFRSFLWGFPLLIILFAVFNHSMAAAWGIKGLHIALGIFIFLITLMPARLLAIHRNPFQVGMFAYCVVITIGLLALAAGWIPSSLGQLPMLAGTILFLFIFKHRPARMDYSLFLRASQGLLQPPISAEIISSTAQLNRQSLLAYARFLGSHWLVVNFRWETSGLALRLPPVKPNFSANMMDTFVPMNRHCSFLLLMWDGSVTAHCGTSDESEMHNLKPGSINAEKLEEQVALVAQNAWQSFAVGDLEAAKRVLGNSPESDVFVVPPRRSASTRWMRWVLAVSVVVMALAMVMNWHNDKMSMVSGRHLKPIACTEADVRATLSFIGTNLAAQGHLSRLAPGKFLTVYVLPPPACIESNAWVSLRGELLTHFNLPSKSHLERLDSLLGSPDLLRAVINGWLSREDFGLSPEQIRQSIRNAPKITRQRWFEPEIVQVSNYDLTPTGYSALNAVEIARRIACLKQLGCIEDVDGSPATEALLKHQVLNEQLPADRRKLPFPKLLHGLFLTFGSDPISETYSSLVVLESFGALSRVDRNACIRGILRFHHGEGLFGSVKQGDGFVIFGDSSDTFWAFESLRILGGLDQVKDLTKWRFRPHFISDRTATTSIGRDNLNWHEIEAWVCQQRLERILRERKENPAAPIRSLLEP